MKTSIVCPECSDESQALLDVELMPKNDCIYEIECPNGHRFLANVLYHEFQKYFEVAVNALADNYYREAIGSFAASYERFMELFIRVVMRSNNIDSETISKGWKKVASQSERQLGAFIFLFLLEFKTQPSLLSDNLVNLRNKAVHKGYFPTKQECVEYGTAVLKFIRETILMLQGSVKHHKELIRSINDQGDFTPNGPNSLVYPYHLISTNQPASSDDKTLEEMLAAEIKARQSSNKRKIVTDSGS